MPMTPIKLNQLPLDRLRAERVAQRRLADEAQGIDLLAERVEHRLSRRRPLSWTGRASGMGRCRASGRTAIVTRHQTIMTTPMTVVAPMIFNAWSLDSWMPLMFTRQK